MISDYFYQCFRHLHLFLKEAVKVAPTYIELLNPVSESSKKQGRGDPVFGIILPFTDGLLVTYNEDFIYLVNPSTVTITAIISNLRKVTDVACTEDEIFILEGERNVIRIACYPEITNYDTGMSIPTLFTVLTTTAAYCEILSAILFFLRPHTEALLK